MSTNTSTVGILGTEGVDMDFATQRHMQWQESPGYYISRPWSQLLYEVDGQTFLLALRMNG